LRPRAWITLPGCNFNCRGCFAIAKRAFGTLMSPSELVALLKTASTEYYGQTSLEEVMITGGEPALDGDFLVSLVSSLREITPRILVQTNASLLTPELLDRLIDKGLDELVCDLKAWDDSLHRWYTGHTNQAVLRNIKYACGRMKITVNTLLIPDVVDAEEIEALAHFLSQCDPKELEYRINPFRADLSPEPMSREPNEEEMKVAVMAAERHLEGSVRSRSCLRESEGGPTTHWITVFPDGRMERRGMENYRERNRALFEK
jgi:pyruvate-formate lyase-activating enzyme